MLGFVTLAVPIALQVARRIACGTRVLDVWELESVARLAVVELARFSMANAAC